MKKDNKKEQHGKFIEEQLNELKNEQLSSINKIEEEKNSYANKLNETIDTNKDAVFNSDYFNDALRKIDADRISAQMDIENIDTEIENEEKVKDKQTIDKKKELIEKKYTKVPVKQTVEHTKPTEIKTSFFDKLLRIL